MNAASTSFAKVQVPEGPGHLDLQLENYQHPHGMQSASRELTTQYPCEAAKQLRNR
jgi:hypothetical protein